MIKRPLISTIMIAVLLASSQAQTIIRPQAPKTQAQAQAASNQRIENGQKALQNAVPPPIPEDVLQQAAQQRAGDYGLLKRPAMASGMIQEAWNEAYEGQGVRERLECGTCVYKVRTREFMVTALQFPQGVEISQADLGDETAFDMKQRAANTLVVMPKASGVDSSMQVYAKDGRIFSFYLRAEGINSNQVPDLLYKIIGQRDYRPTMKTFFSDDVAAKDKALAETDDLSKKVVAPIDIEDPKDFIKEAKYDPSKLRGWNDYKLFGDEELRPLTVFRDDYFTYIQFGDKWPELELPTAYVVHDDYDELVNTRTQNTMYIVESTARLITLKSGKKYLCIEYRGE